ncbi:MAG: tetrahydromethanopterin S-methyltransferase subunit G [Candidatus Azobacteroides sp.]|nr:tetrahydromethanopterin S-methyltransferase subunit G [Candidatus Azobacteroides sp.]
MSKTIELHQERNFSNKISTAFDFIKQNFKGLSKPILYIALPVALLSGFFMSEYLSAAFSTMGAGRSHSFYEYGGVTGFILNYVGLFLSAGLGTLLIVSSIFSYISLYDEDKDRDITYSMVFSRLRQRIGRFIGYNILYGMMIGLILVIVGVICFGPAIYFMTNNSFIAVGVILYFLMLFVFIFLILFVIAFSYILQNTIFFEDLSPGRTLSRTFELMKGNWWNTIGLLIVVSLMINVIALIFVIPLYIALILNMVGIGMEGVGKLVTIVMSMITMLGSFLVYPLLLIPMALQYFNLVEKKDGTGLLGQIEKIGEIENFDKDE